MGSYTGSDKRLKYLFEHGGGGGGSANIWTGTMAEYLAQASQIADDTAVFITDDEIQSLIVSSYDVYSTEEKEVGVWTDGKPLYQRTFEFNNITLAQYGTADIATLSDIDHIHVKNAYCIESSIMYDIPEYGMRIQYTDANKLRVQCTIGSWTNANGSITIQYTKTTDIAGSGLFVPSGAAAVHYSTTEQVIGTWINGKPLYSKTVSVSVNVNNSLGGNIYHAGVDISSYIPNMAILLPRTDKSYLDLGNNTIRGFIAVLPEDDRYLDVYTAYQRQGTAILTVEYTKTTD